MTTIRMPTQAELDDMVELVKALERKDEDHPLVKRYREFQRECQERQLMESLFTGTVQ